MSSVCLVKRVALILSFLVQVEGNGASPSHVHKDLDRSLTAPAPSFPGFVETPFSTPQKRFFYKESRSRHVGTGIHALVEQ
jgi:hypothetical protein